MPACHCVCVRVYDGGPEFPVLQLVCPTLFLPVQEPARPAI